jgi:hypothetical protein
LEEDNASTIKRLQQWLTENEGGGDHHDLIDELGWMLRLDNRLDEAAKLADGYLSAAGNDVSPLLVDRAYVDIASGNRAAARARLERLRAAEYAAPKTFLVHGFLLYDEGNQEAARAAWGEGLRTLPLVQNSRSPNAGSDWLFFSLLGSLSGQVTDEEMEAAVQNLLADFGVDSGALMMLRFLTGSNDPLTPRIARSMRQMWTSDRGMELARKIAYQQTSFLETVRDPAILLAVEMTGPMIRPEGLSPEEIDLEWQFGERLYHRMLMDNSIELDRLAEIFPATRNPNLAHDTLDKFRDVPDVAGPLAYFFGVRNRERPEVAKQCFALALEFAEPDSLLARLAQTEQTKLRSLSEE